MSGQRDRWIVLAVCAALAPWGARADRVLLDTGKTIEGVILRTNATEIVVGFGVGEVTLRRSQVREVHHDSADANARVQSGWQQRHFAHVRYVPTRFQDLGERFRILRDQRAAAQQAVRRGAELEVANAALRKEIQEVEARWTASTQQVMQTPAMPQRKTAETMKAYNDLVQAYNDVIFERNRMQETLAACNSELKKNEEARETSRHAAGLYLHALAGFQTGLSQTEKDLASAGPLVDEETAFLGGVRKELEAWLGEVQRISVPCEDNGRQAVLTVRINDGQEGRLVLDTGATAVVLSQAAAVRLGIDLAGARSAKAVLANGEQVAAKAVVLDSVQTGDARVERVPALVMERAPGVGVDGLLGMSFLEHFLIRYEPGSRKVELIRLAPGR